MAYELYSVKSLSNVCHKCGHAVDDHYLGEEKVGCVRLTQEGVACDCAEALDVRREAAERDTIPSVSDEHQANRFGFLQYLLEHGVLSEWPKEEEAQCEHKG